MLTPEERKTVAGITFAVVVRMLGLFLLLPVLSPYVRHLEGSTPVLTGLAVGVYGLTQAVLQIPFGYLSDRVGRKPVIIGGFLLYTLGSLVGGLASNIWAMVVARALQGAGAISSAAISLAADLIREEVRSSAFARIGASISLTFALSVVLAPLLAGGMGVPFIFFMTAFLSVIAMIYIGLFIREPERHSESLGPLSETLPSVLFNNRTFILNLSVFILHALLISLFTVVPVELITSYHFPKPDHWKIYLPTILVSVLLMVPAVAYGERRGRIREVVVAGVFLIWLGFASHLVYRDIKGLFLMVLLFFVGFHLLEPVLPSLLTKVTRRELRGLSVGVFNTVQFVGAFSGGLMGGLYLKAGAQWMVVVNLILSSLWFLGILLWVLKERS